MGERLNGIQKVRGSSPLTSTRKEVERATAKGGIPLKREKSKSIWKQRKAAQRAAFSFLNIVYFSILISLIV